MKRKLVKQGKNALTITLPHEWVRENALNSGDYVEMNEEDDSLCISKENNNKITQECNLNLVNLPKNMIYHYLMGKYVEGYDKIIIKHNNPQLIQEASKILIGFIIEEHDEENTILKNLISVPEENFETIFRRTLHLLLSQARMIKNYTNSEIKYQDIKKGEHLLDDNILYCMRYLNKYKRKDKNRFRDFLLLSTIEQAGDQLTEISKSISNNQDLALKIEKGIEKYVSGMLAYDMEQLYYELREFKNSIEQNTFVEGLAYSLAENLYNYIGFIKQ